MLHAECNGIKNPWLGEGWGSLTPLSRMESVPGQIAEPLGPYIVRDHGEWRLSLRIIDILARRIVLQPPQSGATLNRFINSRVAIVDRKPLIERLGMRLSGCDRYAQLATHLL